MNIEEKAKEVLRLMKHPMTIDPVANDMADQHNTALLVAAMRWAVSTTLEARKG